MVSWLFSVASASWTKGLNLLCLRRRKERNKNKSSGKNHLQDVKSYRGRIFKLDFKNNFFSERVAVHWNRLPYWEVESPSLEMWH